MSMKVHFGDQNLAVASWRNVQLQFFTGPLLIAHPPVVTQVRAGLAAQYPHDKIYALTLIQSHVMLPEPAARDASGEMLRYLSKSGGGSAYVVEGSGLRVSAMRTFVSVMLMASHSPFPTQVFSLAGDGVEWLVGDGVKCRVPAAEFRSVVEELRRHHLAALEVRASA